MLIVTAAVESEDEKKSCHKPIALAVWDLAVMTKEESDGILQYYICSYCSHND